MYPAPSDADSCALSCSADLCVFQGDSTELSPALARAVRDQAQRLCSDCSGASWTLHCIPNRVGFCVPCAREPLHIDAGAETLAVSAEAFGLIATIFALSRIVALTHVGAHLDALQSVKRFASTHSEAGMILRAIS